MPRAKQKDGLLLHLDKMSTADKLRAMESLWDDLCRRADGISSPMWHHDILTAREQGVLAGESNFCEWETAKIKIRESNS
ncbi:MAG: addiction module protein [Candidatus Omnitrophota bacterium]